ncbi:MAG: DUF1822 family protein [Elainellaceae cyanobacterium]
MSYTSERTTIQVPISQGYRKQAETFAKLQPTQEKAAQVYRNTLAVLATRNYLDLLDIDSDLERSYSWDLASHLTMDVADLYIPELDGRLECRAVQPGDSSCYIPEDVLNDRVGYMIVQMDAQYNQGIMLGFVKEVSSATISLEELAPLDDFLDCLPEPEPEPAASVTQSMEYAVNRISDWLDGLFRPAWQPTPSLPSGGIAFASVRQTDKSDELSLDPRQIELIKQMYVVEKRNLPPVEPDADSETILVHLIHHSKEEETRFKAAEMLWQIDPTNPAGGVRRVFDLSLYVEGFSLGLLGAALPLPNGKLSMLFRVYPVGTERFIPEGLRLSAINEQGSPLLEVVARSQDDQINLKLVADPGDRFSIQVVLNDSSITEPFSV